MSDTPERVCCECGGVGWTQLKERGGYTQDVCVCRLVDRLPDWMLEEVVCGDAAGVAT